MLAGGRHAWNSGIFLFAAATMLAEAGAQRPDMLATVQRAVFEASTDGDFLRLDPDPFVRAESISIGDAILEASTRNAVSPVELKLERSRCLGRDLRRPPGRPGRQRLDRPGARDRHDRLPDPLRPAAGRDPRAP